MGCGSSKDENPEEIKSEMKKTLIPEYDDLFEKAGSILEKGEALRSGLGESTDKMNELARIEILKDGDFKDAILAWLWSVSANFDGNIQASCLKIEESKPYVSLDLGETYVDCYNFQENLKKFIATCIEGPGTMIGLIKDVTELSNQAKDFPANAKDAAKNAGLTPLQAIKAVGATAGNLKTVASGIPKLQKVADIVNKALADLKLVLPKIPDMIKEADEVGKKAFADGKKTPGTCIEYSKKEKKTPAELEALKKAKEEQEKKKKGNKKGKKEKKEHEKKEDKKDHEHHHEEHKE